MGPVKPSKSKAERKRDKMRGSAKQTDNIFEPLQLLDFDLPTNVGDLQRQDSTLKCWFEKVTEVEGITQGSTGFLEEVTHVIKGGILYQCKGYVEALALPQQFREKVMDLGYTVP